MKHNKMISIAVILSIGFSAIHIATNRMPEAFKFGSEIMDFFYGIALATIAASIFYLFQVVVPEKQRQKIVKRNFKLNYTLFKKRCIFIFLFAGGFNPVSDDLVQKLLSVNEFKAHFQGDREADQGWYAVLNGLDDQNLKELTVQLEILSQEIEFFLNNIPLHDEEIFDFLKTLKITLNQLKNTTLDDDEIKTLSRFLWELFAGWSFISGYRKNDIFEVMLNKV